MFDVLKAMISLRPLSVVATLGLLLAAGLVAPTMVGCRKNGSVGEAVPDSAPPKGAVLRLLVIDDSAMAAAIRQLQAEWSGQSAWNLDVREVASAEWDPGAGLEADALIMPSAQLGTLAQRDLLLPLPDELARSRQADWSEIFDLTRSKEVAWAGDVVAVPFGSPLLTCYYRADLFEKLKLKPPVTWKEYRQLAELLSDPTRLGDAAPPKGEAWRGTLEPLASGWAGITLVARAAAYASHRGNYSTFFDIDTMEPLIDGPPFVRALEELVTVAGPNGAELLGHDPSSVRQAFWDGHCAMALTWPTAAAEIGSSPDANGRVGFAETPGSENVYNVTDRAWEIRRKDESPHVSLLAAAGRIGVVPRTSKWPDAAFQLLLWLSDPQWSKQVSTSSPATTLFRQSHWKDASKWVERPAPVEAAVHYAELTEQALSRRQSLIMLRIPGRAEYLAALDEAVRKSIAGEASPEQALKETAARWREITGRLGVENQRDAYGGSLGLE